MFADKYKRWLEHGCPVGPSVTKSFQSNETNTIHGLHMATTDVKEGLLAVQADVEALKKGLGTIKEDVAVMKKFGLVVDGQMGKLVNIGKVLVVCNVVVLMIVVLAVLVKLLV